MPTILIVEDDGTLGMTLEMSLQSIGHDVTWCITLEKARQALQTVRPDLVVLDLGLPDGDGMDFCRELRGTGSIAPILILTARGTLQARVEGLTSGADDYVTKPFELPELLARVEALLRRESWHKPPEVLEVGEISVDFRQREATRHGEPVPMTELELRLLQFLVSKRGDVVSREELLEHVWGLARSTRTRTVDVFVGRLRRYIEANPSRPRILVNVRGVGYRLRIP